MLAVALAPAQTNADPVADFYRDKQVTLLIGYSLGGGYDLFARAVVATPKYIPGNPTLIAKNMPDAGSLILATCLANVARRRGTEFAALGRKIPTIKLLGDKETNFDPTALNWIGKLSDLLRILVHFRRHLRQAVVRQLVVGRTTDDSCTTNPLSSLDHRRSRSSILNHNDFSTLRTGGGPGKLGADDSDVHSAVLNSTEQARA